MQLLQNHIGHRPREKRKTTLPASIRRHPIRNSLSLRIAMITSRSFLHTVNWIFTIHTYISVCLFVCLRFAFVWLLLICSAHFSYLVQYVVSFNSHFSLIYMLRYLLWIIIWSVGIYNACSQCLWFGRYTPSKIQPAVWSVKWNY